MNKFIHMALKSFLSDMIVVVICLSFSLMLVSSLIKIQFFEGETGVTFSTAQANMIIFQGCVLP